MENKAQDFEGICKELAELHARKNAAYGDSFARTFERFGIAAPTVRMMDKVNRLGTFATSAFPLDDESVEDTLKDLAAYAIMTLAIWRGCDKKEDEE